MIRVFRSGLVLLVFLFAAPGAAPRAGEADVVAGSRRFGRGPACGASM